MPKKSPPPQQQPQPPQSKANSGALQSVAQALVFPPGMYRFHVKAASPALDTQTHLPFPALLVAAGPGLAPGVVEFVGSPSAVSAWLFNAGDNVTVKVAGENATLILSSLRTPETSTRQFDIKVEQLDVRPAGQLTPTASQIPSLKLQIGVYVRGQKDVLTATTEWAGRAGSGAWIEAVTIKPQEILAPADIEYKCLSANGFETPWLSNGAICGTKGANMPLIGFAARLKPQIAVQYDCEYSIAFRSGTVVGPLRNGVPARSKTAGDVIEAMQIRIVKRAAAKAATQTEAKAPISESAKTKSPKFGAFREEEVVSPNPAAKTKKAAKAAVKPSEKMPKPIKTLKPQKPTSRKVSAKKAVAKTPTKRR